MVDPNCRPAVIEDLDAYLDRFERVLHRADIVKVSVEDLGYLCPASRPRSRPRRCSTTSSRSSSSPTARARYARSCLAAR
jgi:hypothetical protein